MSHDVLENVVKGGRRYYGQAIGIILYNTLSPRIPGDIGNASTFDFPVRLKFIEELDASWVMRDHPDSRALSLLIEVAQELEKDGVRAITTSCGFTVIYQRQLANSVSIPVFTSSLIQIPMIHRMLGSSRKIGIIASTLEPSDEYLRAAGIDKSIPLAIELIPETGEFHRRERELKINPQKVEKEIVEVAKQLVTKNPTVGAIVLECTQLPSFAFAIQKETNLPVFDIYSLTKMVHESLFRRSFFRHRPQQFFDDNEFV